MSQLVAGVDSSTQSCKVVIRDADTGAVVRSGQAAHPDGTEVDPTEWWAALERAIEAAGGMDDVTALAVAAQQHGMVCLDQHGQVVRPALLWNDTRSAKAADDLIAELGPDGAQAWAQAVGSVPVASFTVTKLRWLADHEPENAERTSAVCLPHDWLTWRLAGSHAPGDLCTDRGDASGTGYWSPATGEYRHDLLARALGHDAWVPAVLGPADRAGTTASGVVLGPGTGDNAGAALGLGAQPGDVIVSVGTSGVVTAIADRASADPTGAIAGFADATGHFLPLVCTLNAARVLDAVARMLGVDHNGLSDLALSAPSGAGGAVLVPYLEGERTPNRPHATASFHGLTLDTTTPAHVARAAVEGLLCGLADGIDALVRDGIRVDRLLLIGGGARSRALREIAPAVLGSPVLVLETSEYVADGAARQAAWVLADSPQPPAWQTGDRVTYESDPAPWIRERYAEARNHILDQMHG
jgi:xylulokinase